MTFCDGFCQSLLFQTLAVLAPLGRVQSGLVEYFQPLAQCGVCLCPFVLGVHPKWTKIRWTCPWIACSIHYTCSTVALCFSNLLEPFFVVLLYYLITWHLQVCKSLSTDGLKFTAAIVLSSKSKRVTLVGGTSCCLPNDCATIICIGIITCFFDKFVSCTLNGWSGAASMMFFAICKDTRLARRIFSLIIIEFD